MPYKNILKTAVILATLAPIASANASAWSNGTGTYELDRSKQACTAITKTRNQHLIFNFPKDGIGFPIIRVFNRIRTPYLGVATTINGQKFRAFAHRPDGSRTESHYFMPESTQQLKDFISHVKAKSVLQTRLLMMQGQTLRYAPANFSLSGSTNAMNALQRCLGGQLISNSQKSLIKVLKKYENSARAERGTNDREVTLSYGDRIFQALRRVNEDGHLFEPLERSLKKQENNPRYHSLKKTIGTQRAIVRRENKISTTLLDNQDFYGRADSIIADLRNTIKSEKSELVSLKSEKKALMVKINSANAKINVLMVDVNRANDIVGSTSTRLSQSQNELERQEFRLSSLNSDIRRFSNEIRNLESQTETLEQELERTSRRYRNRAQIRANKEREIEQRFNGTVADLENSIATIQRKQRNQTNKKQKVQAISQKASRIVSILDGFAGIKAKIVEKRALIKELKPNKADPKVQKRIEKLKAKIVDLKARRDNKLAKVAAVIAEINIPNNAGKNFAAAITLKQCAPTAKAACLNKANKAIVGMNELQAKVTTNLGNLQAQLSQQQRSLGEMNNALAGLANLENRLLRRKDEARQAYSNNTQSISDYEYSLRERQSTRDDVKDTITSLYSEIGRKQARLDNARAELRAAQRVVTNFKTSVNYDSMLANNRRLASTISNTQRSLSSHQSQLTSNLDRQLSISKEIDTYPTRIATAQKNEVAAQAILNKVAPEFNALDSKLRNTRSEYQRVLGNVAGPLKTFQSYYKAVIKNIR
jgi:chromosome segregation ATPase